MKTVQGAWRCVAGGLVVVALVLGVAAPAWAADRDGDRGHARACATGKAVQDKLKGGEDEADWRYIEVMRDGPVGVSVVVASPGAPIRLRLTDSDGKVLGEDVRGDGKGRYEVKAKASAGVVYVEVALVKGGEVEYTLTVTPPGA